MSVLIVFALWFLSGFAVFLLIRNEGDTRADMITITIGGFYSVLLSFCVWLALSDWANKPYK